MEGILIRTASTLLLIACLVSGSTNTARADSLVGHPGWRLYPLRGGYQLVRPNGDFVLIDSAAARAIQANTTAPATAYEKALTDNIDPSIETDPSQEDYAIYYTRPPIIIEHDPNTGRSKTMPFSEADESLGNSADSPPVWERYCELSLPGRCFRRQIIYRVRSLPEDKGAPRYHLNAISAE